MIEKISWQPRDSIRLTQFLNKINEIIEEINLKRESRCFKGGLRKVLQNGDKFYNYCPDCGTRLTEEEDTNGKI